MSEFKKYIDNFMKDKSAIQFQEKLKLLEIIFKAEKNYKDAAKCEELRNKGNFKYNNGNIFEAIKLYNECIAYGPFNSDALAKAYANRAATLLEGGLYKECIEDINTAYHHGHSKTEEKLLIRLAFCQFVLNEKTELKKTIKHILSVSTTFKEENEIMEELKSRPKRQDQFVIYWYREPPTPPLSYKPNEKIPCASSAVKIAFDTLNGPHLVATRDIKIGDVLMVEKPYSVYLLQNARYYHCSHCMKFCLNLIPCENCVWAMFCSMECKTEAENEYHKQECSIVSKYLEAYNALRSITCVNFSQSTDMDVGIIRCLCKAGPDKIKNQIDIINNTKKVRKASTDGFVNGIYDSANFETVLNFSPNIIKLFSKEGIFSVGLISMLVEKCFNPNKEFDSNGFITLCFMIRISYEKNSFPIMDIYLKNKNRKEKFGFMTCPLFSLTTSSLSCYPNCTSLVYGSMKVILASLPIKKGSLITRYSVPIPN